jgi:hypothetical protein
MNMKKFFTRFATIAMSMAAIFAFVSCEENKADDGVMPESDATVEVAVVSKDAQ